MKITIPKKQKIDDVEEIALPVVRCDVCGNDTTTGLHQQQLIMVRKAKVIKIDGRWIRQPPVMKHRDVYMCTNCVKRGKKWPGKSPR